MYPKTGYVIIRALFCTKYGGIYRLTDVMTVMTSTCWCRCVASVQRRRTATRRRRRPYCHYDCWDRSSLHWEIPASSWPRRPRYASTRRKYGRRWRSWWLVADRRRQLLRRTDSQSLESARRRPVVYTIQSTHRRPQRKGNVRQQWSQYGTLRRPSVKRQSAMKQDPIDWMRIGSANEKIRIPPKNSWFLLFKGTNRKISRKLIQEETDLYDFKQTIDRY